MSKPATRPAFLLFFPLAAFLAAVTVPLSIWATLSGSGWPAGLVGGGHGFELIFGFALALIAGYTLGPQPARILWPLITLWVAARLLRILWPDNILALALSIGFALLLAWHVVPRFNSARQWRNRATAPLILTLCVLPLLIPVAAGLGKLSPTLGAASGLDPTRLLHTGVVCLLLLMSFIGGRMIAPAAALTLEQRGIEPRARLQPRMEGALIILLGLAIAVLLIPGPATRVSYLLAGPLLVGGGLILAVRTLRWQLWHCGARPDLMAFGIGYLWLALGSMVSGFAFIMQQPPAAALHLITVGGLGTLSTSVMLRLYFQRTRRQPPPAGWALGITGLIAIAALTRYLSGSAPYAHALLLGISAASWSAAYLLLTVLMLRLGRRIQAR